MKTFSVIVPTFNRKEKIKQCLKSLYNQDFDPDKYEIIVVDDGSTDGTYRSLLKEDILLLRLEKRMGPSVARNFGASKAKGKYLAFTDDDCYAPSYWLTTLLDAYKRHDGVVGVGGGILNKNKSIFGKYENYVYKKYQKNVKEYISTKRDEAPFALGNMSYERETFLENNGFSEKLPYYCSGEDVQLKERLIKKRKRLLFTPIYVEHKHDFSLKSFYNQSLQRGAGKLLHSKTKGRIQSVWEIIIRLLLSPLYFLVDLLAFRLNLTLAFVDLLFYIFSNFGKLKYYQRINKLKV